MINLNYAMLLADTVRSRAYLYEVIRNGFLPSFCVLLMNAEEKQYPGQTSFGSTQHKVNEISAGDLDIIGLWVTEDLTCSLMDILEKNKVPYVKCYTKTVNDTNVINIMKKRDEKLFIFSGYGGDIVKSKVLSLDINLLHVHGGYLPAYKGSTTNYYSILREGKVGASAIMLTDVLDTGPIIFKREFGCPENRTLMDYFVDPGIRAKVLVGALQIIEQQQAGHEWEIQNPEEGETYFVIHPLLKHIAIAKALN